MIEFNGKQYDKLTDELFEEIWKQGEERNKKVEAEYESLPEAEKERLQKKFSDPFYERISENPLADD